MQWVKERIISHIAVSFPTSGGAVSAFSANCELSSGDATHSFMCKHATASVRCSCTASTASASCKIAITLRREMNFSLLSAYGGRTCRLVILPAILPRETARRAYGRTSAPRGCCGSEIAMAMLPHPRRNARSLVTPKNADVDLPPIKIRRLKY